MVKTISSLKDSLVSKITDSKGICPGKDLCIECFWLVKNGGQCPGCDDDYQQRCLKRKCNFICNSCSGGDHAFTPGCCGRTVILWQQWRDRFKEILEYPLDNYSPTPLDIKCRLIPVLYPEVKKYRIPERFPQIDVWATTIRRVANLKGQFHSNDLKDYLGLPSDRKLILDTCAPDDYEEMLWAKGPQMKYKKNGINYWFPAHFSIYDDDSKLYQFISAKRQQIHAVWTQSQFVWFCLGENIPVEFLNPIKHAPSVLISTNNLDTAHNIEILLNEMKIADSWFPPETAFFVVGSPKQLGLSSSRKCYSINTSWLVRARKGRDLTDKLQVDKNDKLLPVDERLMNNLKEALHRCNLNIFSR